jgi:hypothetical protein
MRRSVLSVVAVAIGLMCAVAPAYDPGTHVSIASKTFDVWMNYDREFYDSLMLPDTSFNGFEVRKFYYIGASLPDLLLPAQMSVAGGMLRLLHGVRDTVRKWYGEVNASLDGPLSITDTTDTNVAVPVTYDSGELPLNSNFPKVCEMVQYARARGNITFTTTVVDRGPGLGSLAS